MYQIKHQNYIFQLKLIALDGEEMANGSADEDVITFRRGETKDEFGTNTSVLVNNEQTGQLYFFLEFINEFSKSSSSLLLLKITNFLLQEKMKISMKRRFGIL